MSGCGAETHEARFPFVNDIASTTPRGNLQPDISTARKTANSALSRISAAIDKPPPPSFTCLPYGHEKPNPRIEASHHSMNCVRVCQRCSSSHCIPTYTCIGSPRRLVMPRYRLGMHTLVRIVPLEIGVVIHEPTRRRRMLV